MKLADPAFTEVAADYPARVPTSWLNYCGDQRHIINDGPKGPNTLGEMLYPVVAAYDPDNEATRVGFSLIAPSTDITHMLDVPPGTRVSIENT